MSLLVVASRLAFVRLRHLHIPQRPTVNERRRERPLRLEGAARKTAETCETLPEATRLLRGGAHHARWQIRRGGPGATRAAMQHAPEVRQRDALDGGASNDAHPTPPT